MRIASVIKLPNGLVAVFDEKGQQIPELQGEWKEKVLLIFCRVDQHTEIYEGGDSRDLSWLLEEAGGACRGTSP